MTRFDLVTLVAIVSAVVLAGAASIALLAGVAMTATPSSFIADPWATVGPSPDGGAAAGGDVELVVDVEGGVVSPGIHRLPSGSRVADALAAAGGYASSADVAAAARSLNLAAPLADGQQIYVPMLGEAVAGGDGGADGGLVNLNRASQSELESLPGIGPVTAERIIAARAEAPFATLDELVARDILTARQLEQIRDLVTVP